jgi:hypothetical protein
MGHVLISEMKLPVLGREEDAADTFAALAMLKVNTSFSQRVLAAAAKGWFLSDRRDQQTGAKPLYYDEHNLSQQRAFQIVCFMVRQPGGVFGDTEVVGECRNAFGVVCSRRAQGEPRGLDRRTIPASD